MIVIVIIITSISIIIIIIIVIIIIIIIIIISSSSSSIEVVVVVVVFSKKGFQWQPIYNQFILFQAVKNEKENYGCYASVTNKSAVHQRTNKPHKKSGKCFFFFFLFFLFFFCVVGWGGGGAYAAIAGPDQTAHMRSLIWAFDVRLQTEWTV